MGFTAIIAGLVTLAGKVVDITMLSKLRAHSDALLVIQQKLRVAESAFKDNYDNRDDVEYVNLIQQKIIIMEAFNRDIQLAAGAAK